jgi:hypothetical protein
MDRTTEAKKNSFRSKQEDKSSKRDCWNVLRAMKMKEWRQRQVTDENGHLS